VVSYDDRISRKPTALERAAIQRALVDAVVASWEPLTPAQRARLADDILIAGLDTGWNSGTCGTTP